MVADVVERTVSRLDELIDIGRSAAQSDPAAFRRWLTSAENLVVNFVGEKTPHYRAFHALRETMEDDYQELDNETDSIQQIVGVLEAAKDDITGGFMSSRDLLVSAANFGDILEQAEHLLQGGYKDAAAVLTGAVLETSLRKLCDKHGLPYTAKETMEPLNVKLAKSTAYAPLTQKMITTWGDLRNNAAHGHFEKYAEADVRQMHQWVAGFLEQQLR